MSKAVSVNKDFPAPFMGVSLMGRQVVHIEVANSGKGSLCGTTAGHACGTYDNGPSIEYPKNVCRKCLALAGLPSGGKEKKP